MSYCVCCNKLQETQLRLSEMGKNEERLNELNRELNRQMAQMIREFDDDKRQALDK